MGKLKLKSPGCNQAWDPVDLEKHSAEFPKTITLVFSPRRSLLNQIFAESFKVEAGQ